ncbi:hypothetical protein [Haladaptatus sp. T7]|uniref:hypothetical protein n=1 Tax=Haladaptatus sp. T7 TaxID=2029368 RepID=UPI0022306DA5|nr:hypothetical protein [Haladaptatus sp. T7]
MGPKAKHLLGACLLVVGALLFFSLWVYPFHYGFTESGVLAGLLSSASRWSKSSSTTRRSENR